MGIQKWTGTADCLEAAGVDFSGFKILLKTKDDPWFLRRWFDHHRAIVDPHSILIFDNNSSNPDVLQYYRDIGDLTHVFSFGGNMDMLHRTDLSQTLYGSLSRLCDCFCFLDTDEYLSCLAGPAELMESRHIAAHVEAAMRRPGDFLPTLWLNNVFRTENQFLIYNREHFADCLRWGKPITRASSIPIGNINHNCQLFELGDRPIATGGLIVFHLRELLPEQRIAANMNKLKAFGLIGENTGIEAALDTDFTNAAVGNPEAWQREIRHLRDNANSPAGSGNLVVEDGRLIFREQKVADMIGSFYAEPDVEYRNAFGEGN